MLDAETTTTGGPVNRCGPSRVGTGTKSFKLDLLATTADHRGVGKVSVVGEVKSGQERTGIDQLERLNSTHALDPTSNSSTLRGCTTAPDLVKPGAGIRLLLTYA